MPDLDVDPPTNPTPKNIAAWLLMLLAPFGFRVAFGYLGKRGRQIDEVKTAIKEMHHDIKNDINNLSFRLDAHIDGRLIQMPAQSKNGSEKEAVG